MAMPTARAIRCKSGLAPANTLRAFRFYPYCISSAAATPIVRPHFPPTSQASPKSVAAQPGVNVEDLSYECQRQKTFYEDWVGPEPKLC